jgi:hypothetical protein
VIDDVAAQWYKEEQKLIGETSMKARNAIVASALVFTSVVSLPEKAFALCGTVSASGQGWSRQDAVNSANNKGLRETNRLDRNYGGKVNYQTANLNCWQSQFGSGWNCRITQKFCTK